jgi:hypothetical protein
LEQKLFCCNQPCRDSELQRTIVDVLSMSEGDSKSIMLVVTVCPTNVMENLGQLMPILRQNVLSKCERPF